MSGCIGDGGTIKENEFMKWPFGNSQTRLVFNMAIPCQHAGRPTLRYAGMRPYSLNY